MKKSFSLIELIIVIIVIGILAASMKFSLTNSTLNQAVDQVINHIRYTQQLALRDDKYQAFPLDSSAKEGNRSKYWFKQWWQIRFTKNKNDKNYWYEIFTDLPTNSKYSFDRLGHLPNGEDNWTLTYAKNPLNNKYLMGHCDDSGYPDCLEADKKLNLTKTYGIKKIVYENFYSYSRRLVFDSYGKPYLKIGDSGDGGDINPYDNDKRMPLTKIAKITLCLDDNCEQNKSICIYPETGYVKSCD